MSVPTERLRLSVLLLQPSWIDEEKSRKISKNMTTDAHELKGGISYEMGTLM